MISLPVEIWEKIALMVCDPIFIGSTCRLFRDIVRSNRFIELFFKKENFDQESHLKLLDNSHILTNSMKFFLWLNPEVFDENPMRYVVACDYIPWNKLKLYNSCYLNLINSVFSSNHLSIKMSRKFLFSSEIEKFIFNSPLETISSLCKNLNSYGKRMKFIFDEISAGWLFFFLKNRFFLDNVIIIHCHSELAFEMWIKCSSNNHQFPLLFYKKILGWMEQNKESATLILRKKHSYLNHMLKHLLQIKGVNKYINFIIHSVVSHRKNFFLDNQVLTTEEMENVRKCVASHKKIKYSNKTVSLK